MFAMFAMFAGQSAECPGVPQGVQATNFSLSFSAQVSMAMMMMMITVLVVMMIIMAVENTSVAHFSDLRNEYLKWKKQIHSKQYL